MESLSNGFYFCGQRFDIGQHRHWRAGCALFVVDKRKRNITLIAARQRDGSRHAAGSHRALLAPPPGRSELVRRGAASFYIQLTTFGKTYFTRNLLLGINTSAALLLAVFGSDSALSLSLWAVLLASTVMVSLVGRSLFYVLVVPTTMPGAFFWKNKAFEQHARDIGLADLPQVGVAPLRH